MREGGKSPPTWTRLGKAMGWEEWDGEVQTLLGGVLAWVEVGFSEGNAMGRRWGAAVCGL